ncbi:MAG TPA: serine hydrolase [Gemmatimonadaceae bacterium]|jgi:beta-lactamase class A|nr:serine hydrolase [Gemmatimonadaceae bacterium]
MTLDFSYGRACVAASLLAIVGCASAKPGTAPATAPVTSAANLDATIRGRLDSLPAHSTFYAKQLSTGREVAIRADDPMNTASVIKIPVMILAFRDADAGRLNLDERYTIRPEDLRRGTGLLQGFAVGLQPTLRDLITQMIITSDNTATDIMIAKVGLARVNHLLDSLGYRETRLRTTVGQAFRGLWELADPKNASMTDREVFERGSPSDSGAARRNHDFVLDSAKWLGRTTAREIAHLLEQLELGQLASAKSTTEMRRILRQQVYTSRLPQRVRFRVGMGHKTGDWPPLLGNDVGIMYAPPPSGPIVMAVFTNDNTGSFFDLEATEGRVAEDVLNAWSGPPAAAIATSVRAALATSPDAALAQVYFWRARPGKVEEYTRYIRDVAEPIDHEAQRAGAFLSVTTFMANDSTLPWTHMRVFTLRDSTQLHGLSDALTAAGARVQPDSVKRRQQGEYSATLRDRVGASVMQIIR